MMAGATPVAELLHRASRLWLIFNTHRYHGSYSTHTGVIRAASYTILLPYFDNNIAHANYNVDTAAQGLFDTAGQL